MIYICDKDSCTHSQVSILLMRVINMHKYVRPDNYPIQIGFPI